MESAILNTFKSDEVKALIAEAVLEANNKIIKNNPLDEEEEFLSQSQAANFLRVTIPTIIKWKKAKKIPYYQAGYKIFYKKLHADSLSGNYFYKKNQLKITDLRLLTMDGELKR